MQAVGDFHLSVLCEGLAVGNGDGIVHVLHVLVGVGFKGEFHGVFGGTLGIARSGKYVNGIVGECHFGNPELHDQGTKAGTVVADEAACQNQASASDEERFVDDKGVECIHRGTFGGHLVGYYHVVVDGDGIVEHHVVVGSGLQGGDVYSLRGEDFRIVAVEDNNLEALDHIHVVEGNAYSLDGGTLEHVVGRHAVAGLDGAGRAKADAADVHVGGKVLAVVVAPFLAVFQTTNLLGSLKAGGLGRIESP